MASTSGRREPHYENDADPDPQPEFSVIDFTGSRRNDVGDVLMDYRGSLNLLGRSLLDVESTFSVLLSLVTVAACHAHNLENDSPGLNANPSARQPIACPRHLLRLGKPLEGPATHVRFSLFLADGGFLSFAGE